MEDQRSVTMCFSDGLLTCTQTAAETVHDTTVTITASLKGQPVAYTAHADAATPTLDVLTSDVFERLTAGETCLFVWGLDTAATGLRVAQGAIVDAADITDGAAALEYPGISSEIVPVAQLRVTLNSAATAFAFGTSNWNATGVTLDTNSAEVVPWLVQLPSQPRTS